MSDADHVFPWPQEQGASSASPERHLVHTVTRRKGGGTSTRVVEVVHVRRGQPKPASALPHPASTMRAEVWPEGFRPKAPPPLPLDERTPVVPNPAQPTAHVMEPWAPTPPP